MRCSLAQDGAEAVSSARCDHNIDLVVADLVGKAARRPHAAAIRAARLQVKTMAVAEGFGCRRVLKAADLMGAQAVLTTPLVSQAVLARVRTLLVRRPAVY